MTWPPGSHVLSNAARIEHGARRLPEAQEYAERLVASAGGIRPAARVLADRHEVPMKTAERMLDRILHARVGGVTADTLDRLWVAL